ncbi:MAG: hypothetical protein HKN33_03000 [Pyrinomonadaceae bacterium]|nr:hypothetical protein [Pyrinomonadaceae bacterium]
MISSKTTERPKKILAFQSPLPSFPESKTSPLSRIRESLGNETCAMARTFGDQVSARQIEIARALASKVGIDERELALEVFDCEFLELSKRAAALLIRYLEDAGSCDLASLNMRLAG